MNSRVPSPPRRGSTGRSGTAAGRCIRVVVVAMMGLGLLFSVTAWRWRSSGKKLLPPREVREQPSPTLPPPLVEPVVVVVPPTTAAAVPSDPDLLVDLAATDAPPPPSNPPRRQRLPLRPAAHATSPPDDALDDIDLHNDETDAASPETTKPASTTRSPLQATTVAPVRHAARTSGRSVTSKKRDHADLTVILALREGQTAAPSLRALSATLRAREAEVIVVVGTNDTWADHNAVDPKHLSRIAQVPVTVLQVPPVKQWRHTPISRKLQAAALAAVGDTILFLSPMLDVSDGRLIDLLMADRGSEAMLGCTTTSTTVNDLPVIVQQGYTAHSAFPNLLVKLERRRFLAPLDPAAEAIGEPVSVFAPSVHCLVMNRSTFVQSGGFDVEAITEDDRVGEGFPAVAETRERWGAALSEDLAALEWTVAGIEIADLGSLRPDTKEFVRSMGDILERVTHFAASFGYKLKRMPMRIVPKDGTPDERLTRVGTRIRESCGYLGRIINAVDRPLDELAWELAMKVRNVTRLANHSVALVSRAASAPLTTKSEAEIGNATFDAAPEFSERWGRQVHEHSDRGTPLRMFTVTPTAVMPTSAVRLTQVWSRWEPVFTHKHLTLADHCVLLAKHFHGAASFIADLPLAALKSRFCGLLAVYFHGGYYHDVDVEPSARNTMVTWLNTSAEVAFGASKTSTLLADGVPRFDLSFFGGKRKNRCVRQAIVAAIKHGIRSLALGDVPTTRSLAEWVDADVRACLEKSSVAPFVFTLREEHFESPFLTHHHATVAWSQDPSYASTATERSSLVALASTPHRRIVTVAYQTPDTASISDAWRVEETAFEDVFVNATLCQEFLTPWPQVLAAYRALSTRHVAHLCGLAAVHKLGGFYAHPLTRPRTETLCDDWIPRRRSFFAVEATAKEVLLWDHHAAPLAGRVVPSVTFFGGVARGACSKVMLDALNAAMQNIPSAEQSRTLNAASPLAFAKYIKLCDAHELFVGPIPGVQLFQPFPNEKQVPRWTSQSPTPPRLIQLDAELQSTATADQTRRQWQREEPGLAREDVTNKQCSEFSERYSKALGQVYKALPMGSMQVDVCRLLALFYLGGVYMDADVEWRRPLVEWFDHRKTLTVVLTSGTLPSDSNDTSASAADSNSPMYAKWFIAASRSHPCIRTVLDALSAIDMSKATTLDLIRRTSVPGMSEKLSACVNDQASTSSISVLQESALGVRHLDDKGARENWLSQQKSLMIAASWPRLLTFAADPLTPVQKDIRKGWEDAEDKLEHVVAGMAECRQGLHADGDLVAWLAKNLHKVPPVARRVVCQVATTRLSGAIFVDLDLRWKSPMHEWMVPDKPLVFLTDSEGKVIIQAFAISHMHNCGLILLKLFQTRLRELAKVTPSMLMDSAKFDFIVGHVAFADALKQCEVEPVTSGKQFYATVAREKDATSSLVSTIPHTRLMFSKVDPLIGNESYADSTWFSHELGIKRSMQSYFSCRDHIGRWEHLARRYGEMPHHVKVLVCAPVIVYAFGGFFADQRTAWLRPISGYLPYRATLAFGKTGPKNIAPWFFAAAKGHHCVERLLELMNYRLSSITNISTLSPGRLTFAFGSRAYFDAMGSCEAASIPLVGENAAVTYIPEPVMPTAPIIIPKKIYVTWKDSELKDIAKIIDEEWRADEPDYERHVVTDAECRHLASKYPELLENYDALPLNVMRADTCRVLIIYYYGGIYMDLDVASVKRLQNFVNHSTDIIIGNETDDGLHFCNWFFAAKPKHPCVARVLEEIRRTTAPSNVLQEVMTNVNFVHNITGPAAFTRGMRGCAAPTLSAEEVQHSKIHHMYASTQWGEAYDSWRRTRDDVLHALRRTKT